MIEFAKPMAYFALFKQINNHHSSIPILEHIRRVKPFEQTSYEATLFNFDTMRATKYKCPILNRDTSQYIQIRRPGSWDSLFEINAADKQSNVIFGEVTAIASKNIFVHASGIEVSTFGLEDLIIVANEKQVMILPRGQSQNVKRILQERNSFE